ncbi:MAG: S8 family serine peptidase, partial [Planctomycetota bacterium]
MLTAVTLRPVSDTDLSPHIEASFRAASNLENYSADDLAGATDWVAYLADGQTADSVATRLGLEASEVETFSLNSRVVSFDATGIDVSGALSGFGGVDFFYPDVAREYRTLAYVPNDPFIDDQWHLFNHGATPGGRPGEDANVFPVLGEYTGEGVTIAIVDDGLQGDHPDIASNYRSDLSADYLDFDDDPFPSRFDDNHGTAVAGISAASGDNGTGVSGAAPDAELASVRLIGGFISDLQTSLGLGHRPDAIDISNNSWGPADPNSRFARGPLTLLALEEGVQAGRDGLGIVYVFAGGNDGNPNLGLTDPEGNFVPVNADGNLYGAPHNSISTITIGAVGHDGNRSVYSTPGAPLLAVAPSSDGVGLAGIVTTDRTGEDGYNATGSTELDPDVFPDTNYTSTFGGTSAAAPLASGVIALMLEANPNLSYRDVQHIIVRTARMNDPFDPGWAQNGAGHDVSHDYGFGVVDAEAAVAMAKVWTTVDSEQTFDTGVQTINAPIPDGGTLDRDVPIATTDGEGNSLAEFSIEHVQLVFNATALTSEDLRVVLTSPDGTESVMVREHLPVRGGFVESIENYDNWTFSSTNHWGENVDGTWTISVTDTVSGDTQASFDSYQLIFTGTAAAVTEPDVAESLPGNISGFVFVDADEDGVKDDNEQGLAGHPVFIDLDGDSYPDPEDPMTFTGGGGLYVFDGLVAGETIADDVDYTVFSFCTVESQLVDNLTATPRTS